jgi:hypothetical protein
VYSPANHAPRHRASHKGRCRCRRASRA